MVVPVSGTFGGASATEDCTSVIDSDIDTSSSDVVPTSLTNFSASNSFGPLGKDLEIFFILQLLLF